MAAGRRSKPMAPSHSLIMGSKVPSLLVGEGHPHQGGGQVLSAHANTLPSPISPPGEGQGKGACRYVGTSHPNLFLGRGRITRGEHTMAESEGISLDQLRVLAERAGLGLT